MEFKVILYVIGGIGYFIYTVVKKAQEDKANKKTVTPQAETQPPAKPVTPPAANPLDDIMREIKRKQAELEAKKPVPKPQAKPLTTQTQKQPKEILIHQKQKGVFQEGNYERDLTPEERIERGKLKIENEGIYKIKTLEEADNEEAAEAFQFDARNAIIGSIILERKY
jgi:hypothetical protein